MIYTLEEVEVGEMCWMYEWSECTWKVPWKQTTWSNGMLVV